MSLSEGKMFTIEALNRIEGFVWPEGAKFAAVDFDDTYLNFFGEGELYRDSMSFVGKRLINASVNIGKARIDWESSLITREEFESVDGWVRSDGSIPDVGGVFDVKFNYGITVKEESKVSDYNWPSTDDDDSIAFWRHHKPQKQEVKPEPESIASAQSSSQEGIESLISKHKAVKEIARLARIELERVEAAEHSLMLSIEAWAESHGFDIRVLSESEEKPELVITDWRDLQAGDVIVTDYSGGEVVVCDTHYSGDYNVSYKKGDGTIWWAKEWKFIRRPEKK
ncbi:MAG: hypothetical protein ACRCXB_08885 [Aeromonadaceae bacterium]